MSTHARTRAGVALLGGLAAGTLALAQSAPRAHAPAATPPTTPPIAPSPSPPRGAAYPPEYGPSPVLAAPSASHDRFVVMYPWRGHEAPTAPAGFTVTRFASGLAHPRSVYVLPNGDVLVAEANTPPHAGSNPIHELVELRAGVRGASANRITLLRDADGDGVAETRAVFATGLRQPFGMALVGDQLYVGNTDGVVRLGYHRGDTQARGPAVPVLALPAGGYNNHWTRALLAEPSGARLYVSVGSGSNAAEHGMASEARRANVLEVDLATGRERVFASGLRNPAGIAWEPSHGALWAVVNERDELGDELVPDYLTRVRDGAFYGWPYSYFGQHVDPRVRPQRPDLVAHAVMPDYALGAHTASLGLVFYRADGPFPARYHGGAFVAQHGSWNRSQLVGYKVVFVPFQNGAPSGPPEDFLTGFLPDPRALQARGRPVGLALDASGALLVADDAGDSVWRVAAAHPG